MKDYHSDQILKFEYEPVTNKFAFSLNHIGAHDYDTLDVTTLTHTDANTIYVNGSTGNDGNAGTAAAPKLTILAAINATTADKVYVLVLNSQHFAEDLSSATTTYLTGLYANTAITATISTRTTPTFADADTIFFGADSGSAGGTGALADPVDTIAGAIAICDGAHQRICEIDGGTYEEAAIEFTGNFLGMYALEGVKPTFKPTFDKSFCDYNDHVIVSQTQTGIDDEYFCTRKLQNGNFVITWSDDTDSTGKFMIISETGNIIKAASSFVGEAIYDTAIATLDNGTFAIAWITDNPDRKGYYKIYSADGSTIIKATTQFEANQCWALSALNLDTGGFVITYSDQTDSDLNIIIFDSDGTITVAKTQIANGANLYLSTAMTLLQNSNFVIVYWNFTTGRGYFQIYNSAGAQIVASTIFDGPDAGNWNVSCTTLGGGDFVIAWTIDAAGAYFSIWSDAGINQVAQQTVNANSDDFVSVTALNDDGFIFFYLNDNDNAYYSIYDVAGAEKLAPQILSASQPYYISCDLADNGNVIVAYNQNTAGDAGYFAIIFPYSWDSIRVSAASTINGWVLDANDTYQMTKLIKVDGAKPTLQWCDIYGCTNPTTTAKPGHGVHGDNETDLSNCRVYDNDCGLYIVANAIVIEDSQFFRNSTGYAIHIDGTAASSGDITIEHTDVFNNYAGIRLENNHGTNEILKNNIIHNNDGYGIEADTSQAYSYTAITDSTSGASAGSSVVLANPLYLNEGAVTPDDIDLNIKTRVEGYPTDSPAKDLGDDDRNCGSHDVRYIGAITTWTDFTIQKPRRGVVDVNNKPVASTLSERMDGSIETYRRGKTEYFEITWDGVLNADYDNLLAMWSATSNRVRIYGDPTTNPTDYDEYKLVYADLHGSPGMYMLSRTGVKSVKMKFGRAIT